MNIKLDAWLAVFGVAMLIAAGSSYRERALLPFGGGDDTAMLGREVSEAGLIDIVSFDDKNRSRFLPRLIRKAASTPGARRRNIPSSVSGEPLTSTPDGSQFAAVPTDNQGPVGAGPGTQTAALTGSPNGGGIGGGLPGGGGFGTIGGPGGGTFTTVPPLGPTDPVTPVTNPPTTPTVPSPTSPVPEPGVWVLFIMGLFLTGSMLRRQKRQTVALNQ